MPEHPLLPDGLPKPCCQAAVAHQNEVSMLRCCIGIDLNEHPFLPVHQPDRVLFLLLLSTA